MGFPNFGLAEIDQQTQFDALLRQLPAMRPTDVERIARSCYQTEYGIYNHDSPTSNRPLAIVGFHPKENVVEGGILFTQTRKFFTHQIADKFGLSLTEFLDLPAYLVQLIYDITTADSQQSDSNTRAVSRQLSLDLE